jgi:hypothetical protein
MIDDDITPACYQCHRCGRVARSDAPCRCGGDDALTQGDRALLDHLHDRSAHTRNLPGPILRCLVRHGYVEVTWAGRARLTEAGRGLYEVCSA